MGINVRVGVRLGGGVIIEIDVRNIVEVRVCL